MSNLGYASMRNGGAFELRFWNWIMLNAGRGSRHVARSGHGGRCSSEMADNRLLYLANLPLRRGTTPLKLAPEYEDWLVEAMRHGANDDFWRQNNIIDHADEYKDMPVYLVGGWYDSWASNTTANFVALTKAIKGPVYLIMGPWIHGQQGELVARPGELRRRRRHRRPAGLAARVVRPLAQGHRQRGGPQADPFATPVRIFVMGTGDGRKTQGRPARPRRLLARRSASGPWPAPATTQLLSAARTAGSRRQRPQAEAARRASSSTRASPVPTIGGNISSGNDIMLQGAWDQRGGDARLELARSRSRSRRATTCSCSRREPLAGRPGSDRRAGGQALGLVLGRGHRLHRQAASTSIRPAPTSPAAST